MDTRGMVTTASKLYFGAAAAALLAAFAYGWGTGGGFTGVMAFGLKGGVGELAGYSILVGTAVAMLIAGIAASVLRDADPEVQAAVARLDVAPPATPPAGPSFWPALGAGAFVTSLVGLVASPVVFVIGLIGLLLVLLEWMVQAWSDRATGDPEVNRRMRNRLMYPIEIPVFAALAVLVMIVSVSRILLTLDKTGSWIFAAIASVLIFGLAALFAYRPGIGKNLVTGIVAVLVLAAIGAGIASAAMGTREFELHEEEHSGEEALVAPVTNPPSGLASALAGSEG